MTRPIRFGHQARPTADHDLESWAVRAEAGGITYIAVRALGEFVPVIDAVRRREEVAS